MFSASISLRFLGEAIPVFHGPASCVLGFPSAEERQRWAAALPRYRRMVIGTSPGWDPPPARYAGTSVPLH